MKNLFLTLTVFLLVTFTAFCQKNLQGAWQLAASDESASQNKQGVTIFGDGYFMFAYYDEQGGFDGAGGGSFSMKKGDFIQNLDFNTEDSLLVGKEIILEAKLKGNKLSLKDKQTGKVTTWQKIDEKAYPLEGVWRFATRVDEDGNPGERREPGPRQTIKLLSGNHFQWAAFNNETKEFFGTGGGTYTAENGQYTEHIEFFSRDNNRVGQSLSFEFQRKGNDWYHKGKSSTGKPLHEIWSIAK